MDVDEDRDCFLFTLPPCSQVEQKHIVTPNIHPSKLNIFFAIPALSYKYLDHLLLSQSPTLIQFNFVYVV